MPAPVADWEQHRETKGRELMQTNVLNPATEQVLSTIELMDARQTDDVVRRSARAFEEWQRVDAADRAKLLRRFAAIVEADARISRIWRPRIVATRSVIRTGRCELWSIAWSITPRLPNG